MAADGAVLSTVSCRTADVAVRFAPSFTVTATVWLPSESLLVSHWKVTGVPPAGRPTAAPSTISCAVSGAVPPVTVAVTGTIRVANDQSAGDVAVTRGGAIPI